MGNSYGQVQRLYTPQLSLVIQDMLKRKSGERAVVSVRLETAPFEVSRRFPGSSPGQLTKRVVKNNMFSRSLVQLARTADFNIMGRHMGNLMTGRR